MELEYIAQCWANTCNGNPLNHDVCRRTGDLFCNNLFLLQFNFKLIVAEFEHVGQNLGFINSSLAEIDVVKALKQLILLWYDEVAIYKNEWVNVTEDR